MEGSKELPIITISREYGAGGRTIAKGLSEGLGLEFYDIDFVKLTAKASGYSEEDIIREGEDLSSRAKFIDRFLSTTSSISSYDAIYQAQREVVLGLAKKPCIIVGRCSNIILREEGIPSFDIFLFADKAHRLKRARELAENGKEDLEKYLEHRDHNRRNYYKTYTKHEMGDYKDYNICIDTGSIGMDATVDLLLNILKARYC
ncbi:MAG: cytidylate kinase-like family protein [Blautia sp.]|nr:cytidylate kinase-like family protein [Blautia sp.]